MHCVKSCFQYSGNVVDNRQDILSFCLRCVKHSSTSKPNDCYRNKHKRHSARSTARPTVHTNVFRCENGCLESVTKRGSRIKVLDVKRNLIPDLWTVNAESALPELGPCPHDNRCLYISFTQLSWLDELLYVSQTSQLDVCSMFA